MLHLVIDSPSLAIPTFEAVPKSTGARNRLTELRKLLHACLGHPKCAIANYHVPDGGKRGDFFPTRLLDLRKLKDTGLIRIVLGETVSRHRTYMTLSHCWGGVYPETLRTLTDQDRETGFHCRKLPPTFLDACLVACELGCSYIWIDALCILQDNKEDWLRESPRMTEVFTRSELTIAGSDSGNPMAGLFRKVEPCDGHHVRVCFTCKCDTAICTGDLPRIAAWSWRKPPLHRRAWVMQEMALSRRVAYFTTTGIYWACMTIVDDEGRQESYSDSSALWHVRPKVPRDIFTWNSLVQFYTSCLLSFSADRLSAIAGLARRCQNESNGQLRRYVAGMWETRLAEQLVWTTHGEGYRPSCLKSVPTWSWASLSQPVEFHMGEATQRTMEMTILDIIVGEPSTPQSALATDIRLRATAPLLNLDVSLDQNLIKNEGRSISLRNKRFNDGMRNSKTIDDGMMGICELFLYEHPSENVFNDVQIRASYYNVRNYQGVIHLDEPIQVSRNVQLVRIPLWIMVVWNTPEKDRFSSEDWCGLLVEPVDDEPGCFKRVGVIFLRSAVIERANLKGYPGADVEQRHLIELV
jgi:hypothetical protein